MKCTLFTGSKLRAVRLLTVCLLFLITNKAESVDVDTLSRFLCGIYVESDDPLVLSIQNSEKYQSSQHQFAHHLWNKAIAFRRENQLSKGSFKRDAIATFLQEQFAEAYVSTKHVVYLFGGPDFGYPDLFFPNMESLILVGQEPIRPFLDIKELFEQNRLETVMSSIAGSLEAIPFKSYHVTEDMSHQMSEYGIETLLAATIVLSGYQIIHYEIGFLDDSKTIPCIRFTYRKASEDIDREVLYISCNLLLNSVNMVLMKLMDTINLDTAFYKATSFITQNSNLASLNKYILNRVKYVIQGDSGIPYAFFDHSIWTLKLFGVYSRPYYALQKIPFYWGFQQDLNLVYNLCVKNLPTYTYDDGNYLNELLNHVSWHGYVPFYFDYGANMSSSKLRKYTSAIQYAIRKKR